LGGRFQASVQRVTRAAAAAALVAGSAVAAPTDLVDASAQLERAYVPALGLTNQRGNDAQAREAVRRLELSWDAFRARAAPLAAKDAALRATLAASSERVQQAAAQAGAGDMAKAHESLEYLRDALWKWRASRGVEYFPDRLTAYHDVMEHLVDAAARALPGDTRIAYAQAVSKWIDVERAPFAAAVHGFDGAAQQRLRAAMASERATLDEFAAAMGSGDPQALADVGRRLKQRFAQLYFLFGDFRGLEPSEALPKSH
jgi:hypothetical protein